MINGKRFVVEPIHKNNSIPRKEYSIIPDGDYFVDNTTHDSIQSKYPPIPYLLIGFDTEYQTPPSLVKMTKDKNVKLTEEEIKESEDGFVKYRNKKERGLLQNRILSYQFHCKIIEPIIIEGEYEGNKTIFDWEGIVYPHQEHINNGKHTKELTTRLSITELFYFIMAKGIKQFPNIKIPTNCYFLSHFSRADIPSLMDFRMNKILNTYHHDLGDESIEVDEVEKSSGWSKGSNLRESLQNTRGVFVSKKIFPVRINEDVEFKVNMRDTILLAPEMMKKLSDIGEMLGIEKIELNEGGKSDKYWKENMFEFREEHYNKFVEYGILDAKITTLYADKIIEINMKQTENYIIPITLTSVAVSKLILMWEKEDWIKSKLKQWKKADRYITGRIEKKYDFFNEKTQRLLKKKYYPFVDNIEWQKDFVINTYHGGRNEQFIFGCSWIDDWSDWDLTSAYPTAMSLIGEADWKNAKWNYNPEVLFSKEVTDLAFAQVEFKFPKEVRYPCLPVRTPSGLIFPREGNSLCGIPEIKLAQRLIEDNGGDGYIRLVVSVSVPTNKKNRVFENFLKNCIHERKLAEEKVGGEESLEKYFWKEMSNSTYGKTAQGLRRRMVYDLNLSGVKKLKDSKITHPYFASFITSMTRASLSEVMNNIPKDKCIFSVTTDGFLTNATDEEMKNSQNGMICNVLKKQMLRLKGNEEILEIKHRVKQTLGWRTRGQATLKEGDWKEEGSKKNLIIAKSGIKLKEQYDRGEENETIIDYFLNREYGDKLQFTNLTGMKDVWEKNNDMESKPNLKTLNMEFDWKRKPSFISETTIEWKGEEHNHLYFESLPWKNLEEYTVVRDNIESFNSNKKELRCLKTKENFNVFKRYLDSRLAVPEEHQPFLHKEDGDIKRLKQMVLCAWRKKEAGITRVVMEEVIGCEDDGWEVIPKVLLVVSYINWKQIFKDVGVKCTQVDVQNSKTNPKEYTPYRIPRTDRTIRILNDLKLNNIPNLKINELLSYEKGIELNFEKESMFIKEQTRFK